MEKRNKEEQTIHDWLIKEVKESLLKRYKKVYINPSDEKNKEVNGFFPDVVVESHGVVVEIYEIETENTVNDEEADEWMKLSKLPAKLTILVPASRLKKAREIAWDKKIASKVKISGYEVTIKG